MLDRKLYKIDMDVRRTGRANYYDLQNVVRTVRVSGRCTPNQVSGRGRRRRRSRVGGGAE